MNSCRDGNFTVKSAKGHMLSCQLSIKQPENNSVLILCHGYLTDKTSSVITKLFTHLSRNCVRFDFHGCGKSEGLENWSYGGSDDEAYDDLRAIVLYLREKAVNVCCILGHSRGGNVITLYVSRYKDVPLAINVAGRWDMEKSIKRAFNEEELRMLNDDESSTLTIKDGNGGARKVTKKCIDRKREADMLRACASIGDSLKGFLSIHCADDAIVPVADAASFGNAIGEDVSDVIIVPDGGHNFVSEASTKLLLSSCEKFLQKHLT